MRPAIVSRDTGLGFPVRELDIVDARVHVPDLRPEVADLRREITPHAFDHPPGAEQDTGAGHNRCDYVWTHLSDNHSSVATAYCSSVAAPRPVPLRDRRRVSAPSFSDVAIDHAPVTTHSGSPQSTSKSQAPRYGAASASPGQGIGSSAAKRLRTFSVIRDTSLS